MALVPLCSMAKMARTCVLFRDCFQRPEVWRCQVNKFVDENELNLSVFQRIGSDEKLAKESKELLKSMLSEAGAHMVFCGSTCFRLPHAHGQVAHPEAKVMTDAGVKHGKVVKK
jgi:hypothetical protein